MENSINAFYEEGEERTIYFCFDAEIFPILPKFLQAIIEKFKEKQDKDAALITSIAAIGGLCVNYTSIYDKRKIEPNLYAFLVSSYGEGKGVLGFIKMLLLPTDNMKEQEYQKAITEWHKADGKPPEPKRKVLIIPANATKIQLLKLIADNDGWAVLFETEADTLTMAMQSKFGEFGDILRCGLQGESTSFTRATDNILVKIKRTNITTVLSGTYNQINRLIKDYGDGLASRFDFYELTPNPKFKNVLTDEDNSFEKWFKDAGKKLMHMYKELYSRRVDKITFTWGSDEQKQAFEKYWTDQKRKYNELYNGEFNGLVNRQGLKCAKIAMVLTMVRTYFDCEGELPEQLVCAEEDFCCALSIAGTLLTNNLKIAEQFKRKGVMSDFLERKQEDVAMKAKAIELWDSGTTNTAEIGRQIGKDRATVHRWLKEAKRK